jgi:nucleoside 2-deoxyribosyltransferase|nr:MAG TPA: Blasticidin M [Caudoviricetes sp.]
MADNRNTGPNHNNNSAGTKKPKCFVMMPFSDHLEYEQNHFSKVFNQIIKPAIMQAGYEPVRVDQNKISDQIIAKIIENIVECDMAICDLSTNNPNVLYELGLRHAFDKPVVLIRDNKTQNIFDIQGISIIQYRSERLYDEVIEDVNQISSVITANKKGNSGYSMMQLVKLSSKAEFNANDVDANPSNINTALLHQIINMLNSSNHIRDNIISNEDVDLLIFKADKIISDNADLINNNNGNKSINLSAIDTELMRMQRSIEDALNYNDTSGTQRKKLAQRYSQINDLRHLYNYNDI